MENLSFGEIIGLGAAMYQNLQIIGYIWEIFGYAGPRAAMACG